MNELMSDPGVCSTALGTAALATTGLLIIWEGSASRPHNDIDHM